MYRVIEYFTDLQDNDYPYNAGDIFPREGKTVSKERFAELSGAANKRGIPLIEEVRDAEETTETVETVETDKAVSVEDEPKKQRRKRKE